MTNRMQLLFVGFVLLCISSMVGCGSDANPVTGKVTFKDDGKPVVQARVVFRGEFKGEAITADGHTSTDGTYQLTTWESGDGAVAGEHQVIVVKPRQPRTKIDESTGEMANDAGDADILPPEIDQKYADYTRSPLKFTVKKGEDNVFNIEVERFKR